MKIQHLSNIVDSSQLKDVKDYLENEITTILNRKPTIYTKENIKNSIKESTKKSFLDNLKNILFKNKNNISEHNMENNFNRRPNLRSKVAIRDQKYDDDYYDDDYDYDKYEPHYRKNNRYLPFEEDEIRPKVRDEPMRPPRYNNEDRFRSNEDYIAGGTKNRVNDALYNALSPIIENWLDENLDKIVNNAVHRSSANQDLFENNTYRDINKDAPRENYRANRNSPYNSSYRAEYDYKNKFGHDNSGYTKYPYTRDLYNDDYNNYNQKTNNVNPNQKKNIRQEEDPRGPNYNDYRKFKR
jgi:hypothetical protein